MKNEQTFNVEIPNIQDEMLRDALETIREELEQGVGDVSGEEVMQKIQELSAETRSDSKLQDRLEDIYRGLDLWLRLDKGVGEKEAREFSAHIVYLCAEMGIDHLDKKLSGKLGDVLDFKK
ncbi:MAG: hypothetical protein WC465_03190 [Patescibacteria group bacterium]